MNGRNWDELIPKRWVAGIVGAAVACVAAMTVASTLIGCAGPVNTRVDIPMSRAAVGVIDTSSTETVSRIVFYDENLRELGELPFRKGGMGDGWADACVWGGALYLAPQGIDKFEPGRADEVLEISLQDAAVHSFSLGEDHARLDCVAANDRYLFACSSAMNGPLVRYDKQTGDVKELPLPRGGVTKLLWTGRSLFVFGTDDGAASDTGARADVQAGASLPSSWVLQLDENLAMEREYDLSSYGSGVRRAVACDGVLYAVCSDGAAGADESGSERAQAGNIVMVDTHTGKVAPYPLPVTDALAVAAHDGRLYIVRQDMVAPMGAATLSVGDLGGGNLESYELEHLADQMAIRGGRLYLADAGTRMLYAYDMKALGADPTATPAASAEFAAPDGTHTYITNLFPAGS